MTSYDNNSTHLCHIVESAISSPTHTHTHNKKRKRQTSTIIQAHAPQAVFPLPHILSLCLGPGNCAGTLCTCACRHLWQRQWRHFRLPPESMQHTICQANFVVQDMRYATQVTAGQQPLPLPLSLPLLQLLSACVLRFVTHVFSMHASKVFRETIYAFPTPNTFH